MNAAGRPLKMLQVANQPGPFYCFLRPLVFELMRRGIEVDVACNGADPRFAELARAGMRTIPLSVGSWRSPRTWCVLRRELRAVLTRTRYDICVVHTPAMSWTVRRQAAWAGVPVVAYTAHGLPFFERQGRLVYRAMLAVERHCARFTDLLIVMNSDDFAAAERYRLVKPGGIVRCIPGLGVDAGRWLAATPADRLAALRAELQLGPETRVLAYLGRLMETKGVLDLVESLARLVAGGRDAALVVAGEGPLEDEMRRLADRRGVASRTHLLGWRDDGVDLMHLADVLVLPSTYREGLPAVLIEAGAAGKPVVAYRNRGSNDVIADGETGYLVPANDIAALTAAVARLLDDAALARRMGEAGRRRVEATFSYTQGAAAQLDAYAAALQQKGLDDAALRGPLGQPVFRLAANRAADPAGPGQGAGP